MFRTSTYVRTLRKLSSLSEYTLIIDPHHMDMLSSYAMNDNSCIIYIINTVVEYVWAYCMVLEPGFTFLRKYLKTSEHKKVHGLF